MALNEGSIGVSDIVRAELVECAQTPDADRVSVPLPSAPNASPVAQAQDATIEQTGAGPPPDGE
jgi:hypothetical protein